MSPPADLDRLSHAALKELVARQWEQIVELRRMVPDDSGRARRRA